MSDSIDPDETAHYEPSHLDLCCLQKPIIIVCGSESVNDVYEVPKSHNIAYMYQRHKRFICKPIVRLKVSKNISMTSSNLQSWFGNP